MSLRAIKKKGPTKHTQYAHKATGPPLRVGTRRARLACVPSRRTRAPRHQPRGSRSDALRR